MATSTVYDALYAPRTIPVQHRTWKCSVKDFHLIVLTAPHAVSGLDAFLVPCADGRLPAQARVARSARALRIGTLRPAIVLYDEPHPLGDEIGQIQAADVRKGPDLLIIMGTSLKVHGLKKLVKEFAKVTHARKSPKTPGIVIFVNKTPPGSEWDGVIDYHVEGDTDSWTEKVIADWKKHKPADWEHQTTLVEGRSPFRISNGLLGGQYPVISYATFP